MILKIFSIHDSAAEAHITPFFLPQDQQAIRSFRDCLDDPKHQFHQHPADYTLFAHGVFDANSGEFVLQEKKSLGNGTQHQNTASIVKSNTNPP